MEFKRLQIEDEGLRELYREISALLDCEPDDPRFEQYADRVVEFIEATAEATSYADESDLLLDDATVELLDSAFVDSFPGATRLMGLLDKRGWRGWTRIQRVTDPAAR